MTLLGIEKHVRYPYYRLVWLLFYFRRNSNEITKMREIIMLSLAKTSFAFRLILG